MHVFLPSGRRVSLYRLLLLMGSGCFPAVSKAHRRFPAIDIYKAAYSSNSRLGRTGEGRRQEVGRTFVWNSQSVRPMIDRKIRVSAGIKRPQNGQIRSFHSGTDRFGFGSVEALSAARRNSLPNLIRRGMMTLGRHTISSTKPLPLRWAQSLRESRGGCDLSCRITETVEAFGNANEMPEICKK
jgi:hypothetical protein